MTGIGFGIKFSHLQKSPHAAKHQGKHCFYYLSPRALHYWYPGHFNVFWCDEVSAKWLDDNHFNKIPEKNNNWILKFLCGPDFDPSKAGLNVVRPSAGIKVTKELGVLSLSFSTNLSFWGRFCRLVPLPIVERRSTPWTIDHHVIISINTFRWHFGENRETIRVC